MLAKVKRFAQSHGVHVWFVTHPAKPEKMDQQHEAPSLMAISGSSHWVNKADFGISIQRPWNEDGTRSSNSEVHVKKSRHRHLGRPGVAHLHFNPATGRYEEWSIGKAKAMTKNTPTAPPDPLAPDSAEIVAFPQHTIKAAKRPVTIESIIEGAAGMAPERIIALIRTAYPHFTVAISHLPTPDYALEALLRLPARPVSGLKPRFSTHLAVALVAALARARSVPESPAWHLAWVDSA